MASIEAMRKGWFTLEELTQYYPDDKTRKT
jgi:hypothetical protein